MKWVRYNRQPTYFLVVETNEIDIVLGQQSLDEFGITNRLLANAQVRSTSNASLIVVSEPTPGMTPLEAYPVIRTLLIYIIF
jgi:hypothetical protein